MFRYVKQLKVHRSTSDNKIKLKTETIVQNAIDSSGTVVTQVPEPLLGSLLVFLFPLQNMTDGNIDKT